MRKRRKSNKRTAERIHFNKKFHRRTGYPIGKVGRQKIVDLIHNGDAIFIHKMTGRVTRFRIEMNNDLVPEIKKKDVGKYYDVLYDKQRKCLITCLTTDMESKEWSQF